MLAPNPSQHLESENLARGNPLYRFSLLESCSSRQRADFSGSTQRIAGAEPEPRRARLGVEPRGGSGMFPRGEADGAGCSEPLAPLPYGGSITVPGIASPGSRLDQRDRQWRP
jgi:hypothetical protein